MVDDDNYFYIKGNPVSVGDIYKEIIIKIEISSISMSWVAEN